jgi:glutamate-1-semialdehyde 2,1-aminomutase
MISVFLTSTAVTDFATAQTTDKQLFSQLFHALLRRGVYLPPSALESWFLNASHTEADIDRTLEAFESALQEVAS